MSLALASWLIMLWFRDISREGLVLGRHTLLVQSGLKWGLVWFLFREVWFFFRIFWAFFHRRLVPTTRRRWEWPYEGILIIPPFQVPVLNTVILLIRGVTATLAHQRMLGRIKFIWLPATVLLGRYFLSLQAIEYLGAQFRIFRRVYGSVFFFGTGFHGLHVCLGTIILLVSLLRVSGNIVTAFHHFGVEFTLWYWHFVDVVWLFLFFWVYAWGRG